MVKKIRVIDETPDEDTSMGSSSDKDMMELAKSIDWKLWEMLQVMQRLEKSLSLIHI